MSTYYGTDESDIIFGTDGDDNIYGFLGDDTIYSGGGRDLIDGGAGNDEIYYVGGAGAVHAEDGDDYIYAKKTSGQQIHVYGGSGNDAIVIDLTISSAWTNRDGHHIFGNRGDDKFIFNNYDSSGGMLIGRIDDLDYSRDSIWLDDIKLDLYDLPSDVRIVENLGQQWLVIDDQIAYALEGARKVSGNSEEIHFPDDQFSLSILKSLPSVAYVDQVNFIPHQLYEAVEDGLRKVDGSGELVVGSGRGDQIFDGLANNGTIRGGDGDDVIDASGGADTVYGEQGNDLIAGGQDKDLIYGGSGADVLYGGSENDILNGDDDNDALYGGTGEDALRGDNGHDALYGGYGNDVLSGGAGADQLFGESGDDRLDGNAGNDSVAGGAGADTLFGQNGEDVIYGDAGDDRISGGAGQDLVWGGAGADVFRIKSGDLLVWGDLAGSTEERNLHLDRIEDFVTGEDVIDLADLDGVSSLSDFSIERTEIGGDAYFALRVLSADERLLINVEDSVTQAEIYNAGNFLL